MNMPQYYLDFPDKLVREIEDLDIIPGPVWPNCCDHPVDSYVASFEWVSLNRHVGTVTRKKFDLYVFDNSGDQEICLRDGPEPQEYASPGFLADFIQRQNNTLHYYWKAYQILKICGMVRWHPNADVKQAIQDHFHKQQQELLAKLPAPSSRQ